MMTDVIASLSETTKSHGIYWLQRREWGISSRYISITVTNRHRIEK